MPPTDKNPSRLLLLIHAAALPIVLTAFGMLRWHAGSQRAALALWFAAIVVAALAFALPQVRRWIYIGAAYVAYPVGWVASRLALGIVFFLVATPTALVLRAVRRDSLPRRFDKAAKSYWIARQPRRDIMRYFRQF
jgi:hypothetical protein